MQFLLLTSGPSHLYFTLAIKSLYAVIPHKDGLLALQPFLDCGPCPHTQNLHLTFLWLVDFVLILKYFMFAGETYKQLSGVAI